MTQEQGAGPEGQGLSLNAMLANALASLEQKRVDFPSLIAVLSLFNLFSVLNTAAGQSRAAASGGLGDLASLLAGVLGGGQTPGGQTPGGELLSGLLQKQGKNLNPQMLMSLISLLNEAKSSPPATGAAESAQSSSTDRRQGRGLG